MSVVSAAVLLRYLGVADYGRYATIFSLMTIVSGVTEAGSANVGVRELAVRDKAEHGAVMANLQGLRVTLTFAGCVLALLFALAAGYTDQMVLGTALAAAGLVVTVLGLTLWIPLQAELKLGLVTLLEFIRQLVTVGVLLALVAGGAGLALLLGAQIPVAIVIVVSTVIAVRSVRLLRPAFHWSEWRRLFADSVPYAAATAIGILYSYVTVVMMSLVATETEVGLFGASFRIFIVIAGIPSLLVASAFPVLARAGRDDKDRLRYGIQRLFDMFLVLAVGAGLLTAAGAPVAIDVVAGPGYEDAVGVLRIQAIALVATFMLALGAFALLALRLHAALVIANVAGLILSSALTLALAPELGAEGAAVANLAGEILLASIYFAALSRGAGIRPSLHAVPRVLLAGGLGAAAAFALGLPALPATLLAAVVFVVAAFVLRAVPAEAVEAFSSLRRGARAAPSTPPPSDPS
jgi:O-antigen/teichoic acid export membrane protein